MADALLRNEPVPTVPFACAGVSIVLAPPTTRFSLRTRTPAGLPKAMLVAAPFADGDALHLGPDEWLLIQPAGSAAPVIDGLNALTDVSERNLAFLVDGPQAEALLQTGCPIDLSLAAFPVNRATRTIFETVEVVIWRTAADRFRVELWRSFSPWLWEALTLAAGDLPD
jgi:sarcosine oxidase, subunit gamma